LDINAEIFGVKVAFPCGLSPTAMHRLAHPEGEIATSRAAARLGIPMALFSYATTSLEDVKAQGNGNPYVMQMCIVKDRNITLQLLKRAESKHYCHFFGVSNLQYIGIIADVRVEAGYKALFLSVDVPILGRRLGEMQNHFSLPKDLSFPNILSTGAGEFGEAESTETNTTVFDDTLEWEEIIPWLKANTKMQVWLKGVLSPEDVEQAIGAHVDGKIISNHGGRQLDGVPATLDALRQCAPVAHGRIQIAMDGGIRRGSDIFKALALGAQFCFIGRIPIWGLAASLREHHHYLESLTLFSTMDRRVLN
jgi:(S)-2-hydroxy-acid oxidase